MKVLLEKGVWLSGWPSDGGGDPPRTKREDNAYEFMDMPHAMEALAEAREYRPFKSAEITDDFI